MKYLTPLPPLVAYVRNGRPLYIFKLLLTTTPKLYPLKMIIYLATKRKAIKKRASRLSAVQMLEKKNERKAELKEKELQLRAEELELQKKRFEEEAEERKERLKFELEERRIFLQVLRDRL